MKEVILHIGTHKTGTSSIQHTLQNFDDGVTRYAGFKDANHSAPMVTIFSKNRLRYHIWVKQGLSEVQINEKKYQYGKILVHEVLNAKRERLIISGEDISALTDDEKKGLLTYFETYKVKVVVVCYVREPLGFAASSFQEIVKGGAKTIGKISPGYERCIGVFLEQLPRGQVFVREFKQRKLVSGDVITDFCRLIGIDLHQNQYKRVNESVSVQTIKLMWLFNRSPVASFGSSIHLRARWELVRRLSAGFKEGGKINKSYFSGLVSCTQSELDFLQQNFDIKFRKPETDDGLSLDSYLTDLSDVDGGVLDSVMQGMGMETRIYANHQEKLIAMYFHLLMPPIRDSDADYLRDIALKFEQKETLDLADAHRLMVLAARARPGGPLIQHKVKEYAAKLAQSRIQAEKARPGFWTDLLANFRSKD